MNDASLSNISSADHSIPQLSTTSYQSNTTYQVPPPPPPMLDEEETDIAAGSDTLHGHHKAVTRAAQVSITESEVQFPQRLVFADTPTDSKRRSREEVEASQTHSSTRRASATKRGSSAATPTVSALQRQQSGDSQQQQEAGGITADGKIQVRVTRDGKSTIEEMEPYELARLYAQQQAALKKMQGEFDFLTVPDWVRIHPLLGSYLAEVVGTFAWVLTLSLASIRNYSIFNKADDTNVTCLPIGFMFTSMVFTFGYISGGHFNPAISIAVFLIRKMQLAQALGYILCQLAASLAAGVVAMLIQGNTDIYVPSVSNSYVSSGIFSEMIYTFAIAIVVLNIGYSRQSGNFFYGFAIGMTMAAGSASVGKISGGAFNPAAATGLQVALCLAGDCEPVKSFWVYWLAPVIGAVIASLIYSQMAQPESTQVLEDHKVFKDTSNNSTGQNIAIKRHRDGPEAPESQEVERVGDSGVDEELARHDDNNSNSTGHTRAGSEVRVVVE